MSEWKQYSIEDFAEVKNTLRIPLSKLEREKRQGDFPYYGASGIIDYVDDYLFEGEHVLISEDGENLKSRKTPIAFKADGKFWVNNHAHILKGKRDEFNDLLVYYFANLNINEFITGAVQPKLSKSNLLSIPIFLPEDEEVILEIVDFLKSLTDKIDLLHRQNQTLEQMAETLFRQWFVERESELIPLGECIRTTSGGTPSRKRMDFYEGGIYQWVKSKELNGGYIFDTEEKITLEALKKSSAKLLPENSVLIAMYGATVGQFAIIGQEATCNQAICACLPNDEFPYTFIYHTIKANVDELKSRAVGSAQQNISQVLIKSLEISVNENIDRFHAEVDPMMQKIKANYTQIRTLTALRDTLLPKLMSGEVSLSNFREVRLSD
ncbi:MULTISPECIES: restriction endonuclease subunit S [unclassified Flagellimonas]|uniref:Restriction endonuclease subunit S n=1 Tax=Flagellimonas sp. MMG031 TaxID=3158549 RepID=A0AAU7N2E6_9FLAO